ncbi:hypothetical protein EVAR_80128_1 [Eumeta japonica]|uniref:Endonuclease/exonuclease/phosphatase domain-containing protein n=1 Tax=Eumeta variegata TaxID=151549 RepID=A0A4C1UCV1_EUMVA|nr:hypothetical protein EVAR_80128_1 [Eumeta japonica]
MRVDALDRLGDLIEDAKDFFVSKAKDHKGLKVNTTAKEVLGEHGKIRIGWVNCRIKAIERPTKCFKCWHYGYLSISCKSNVGRSKHCIKCGEEGHRTVSTSTSATHCLSLAEFMDFRHRLIKDAKRHFFVVIAGDFNSWAVGWGSKETNARGEALLKALAVLDVVLLNCGDKLIFIRGEAASIIDFTSEKSKELMITAWDASIPRKQNVNHHPLVHWWNEEICRLCKECFKMRKASQCGRKRPNSAELILE